MDRQILRILSNHSLDGLRTERFTVSQRSVISGGNWWRDLAVLLRSFRCDVVLLDNLPRLLLVVCLLRWILPVHKWKLVSLDLLVSPPVSWKQRLAARLKAWLLRRVDQFIFYITDVAGLERFYGILPSRCSYVPFKVNHDELPPLAEVSTDGEYVFTGGHTQRDFRTFVEAMRRVDYPGILLCESASVLKKHGTDVNFGPLPRNLEVREDDMCHTTFVQYIRAARIVVVPTLPGAITGVGLSTYLLAMGMRRCVILTEGPSMRGLLTDQAIVVPAGDPAALANAIRQVWEDADLRQRTAAAGRRYAEKLGAGVVRQWADIVDVCGELALARQSVQLRSRGR